MLNLGKPTSSAIRETLELSGMLNLLKAASEDKNLNKMLEEMLATQEKNEKTLGLLRTAKKEAENAEAHAVQAVNKANIYEADLVISKANLAKDTEASQRRISEQERKLTDRETELTSRQSEFDSRVRRENEALVKKQTDMAFRVSEIERRESECAALKNSLKELAAEFSRIGSGMNTTVARAQKLIA